MQQVDSYPGYTGRDAGILGEAELTQTCRPTRRTVADIGAYNFSWAFDPRRSMHRE
jgi:hypothetical protein